VAEFDAICETMKKAAGALRDADVPFLLAGALAAWARGGPTSNHDVDFLVKPDDARRAADALQAAGMRIERPPEGWLLKAWDDDVLVDLIFEPATGPVTDEVIERGEDREVLSTRMRVMALEDVMVTKLLALDETHLDLGGPLDTARPLREQIDWDEVRERTRESPYARAFFALVEALGVVEPDGVR
jgi:putative nucleotidyltransferase-like protein